MVAKILDHKTVEASRTEAVGKPDFAFWATVACWTPHEAAMLSLNLDPEIREPTLVPESAQPDSLSYRRRKLRILRAIEAGQLTSPLRPRAFLAWAKQHGVEIPENLSMAVIDDSRQYDGAAGDNICRPKVVASMQKMILGLAMRGYGYDPAARRGDSVPAIVQDLNELGLSVSENTIRSRLKEAYEHHGRASVDEARRT